MSQFPASPIFSLQIDPLPADSSILANNPILMMFDVVSLLAKNVHIACMHVYLREHSLPYQSQVMDKMYKIIH